VNKTTATAELVTALTLAEYDRRVLERNTETQYEALAIQAPGGRGASRALGGGTKAQYEGIAGQTRGGADRALGGGTNAQYRAITAQPKGGRGTKRRAETPKGMDQAPGNWDAGLPQEWMSPT